MKLNSHDAKLHGKVGPQLAVKLQPLILKAVESSGIERNLVQSALLKELENTPTRIGVATAERLLKEPQALVTRYLSHLSKENSQRQGNFDQNLKLMLARVASAHPEETWRELQEKFPNNRSYRDMQVAATLHAENQGRPLTVVRLPESVTPHQTDLPNGKETTLDRLVDGSLVALDGEVVALRDNLAIGPVAADKLDALYSEVFSNTGFTTAAHDPNVAVIAAPKPRQMDLIGLD